MENVSRALLIAAGILLAVLTISIAVLLFRSGAGVVKAYQNSNEENELNTFNSNFTRMLSGNGPNAEQANNTITIYDIVTVANFAWDNNCKYVDNPQAPEYATDPRILRINIKNSSGTVILQNIQNNNQKFYDELVQVGHTDKGVNYPITYYYEIEIEKYNPAGRIQIINFKPKVINGFEASAQLSTLITKSTQAEYKRPVN